MYRYQFLEFFSSLLGDYRRAGGRARVIERVRHGNGGLGEQFQQMCSLVVFWRDEAAHGAATTITEAEARMAIVTLLRLAQFTANNWPRLTGAARAALSAAE